MKLTNREQQIYDLLVTTGASLKQMAERVGVKYKTADCYVQRIYKHFGVHSRLELIAKAKGEAE